METLFSIRGEIVFIVWQTTGIGYHATASSLSAIALFDI